jgi:hypothetical protein
MLERGQLNGGWAASHVHADTWRTASVGVWAIIPPAEEVPLPARIPVAAGVLFSVGFAILLLRVFVRGSIDLTFDASVYIGMVWKFAVLMAIMFTVMSLLASKDVMAADATAARIMSHDAAKVKQLAMGFEMGLGEIRGPFIEVLGEKLDDLRVEWKPARIKGHRARE